MVSQLENDRQTYIDYILAVGEECNIAAVLNNVQSIKKLSLKELDAMSRDVEDIYNLHLDNKVLDSVLKEIEEHGADYVKEKYLSN